jgi:hypothetical protein
VYWYCGIPKNCKFKKNTTFSVPANKNTITKAELEVVQVREFLDSKMYEFSNE